ncbi:hypothetical protein SGLAM104S_01550 [Streptomyces glaucescens]
MDLAEFAEDEWITWAEGEFCHEWLVFTLRSKGIEPNLGHRAAETHTQLGLVAAGLGVCVVPLLGRHPMPPGVVTVPLRQQVAAARLRRVGEPDQQVQELLKSSGGTNLGMDFLSGALGFDPLAFPVSPEEAGRIVWFDALVNTWTGRGATRNLLMWRGRAVADRPRRHDDLAPQLAVRRGLRGPPVRRLRPRPAVLRAGRPGRRRGPRSRVTEELLAEVTAEIPDARLPDEPGFDSPDDLRRAYARPLLARAAVVHDRIDGTESAS